VIIGEDVAVSVYDGVLGSVLWYGSECSCQCVISGVSYAFSLSPVRRGRSNCR
jgi:hypothetical protein